MATPNNFINQGIAIVKDAIQADNDQKYEDAYGLYKKSLEYFMTGIKHEKNPAMKDTIMQLAAGYMDRAEQIKKVGWCVLQIYRCSTVRPKGEREPLFCPSRSSHLPEPTQNMTMIYSGPRRSE